MSKEQYTKKHDRVCAQLHFNICKEMGVKLNNEEWHDNAPKLLETIHEGKITILANQQVQTDRTITNNKPHVVIVIMKKEHVC
jgi:hypothetical protein